jgi:hypothetical protein
MRSPGCTTYEQLLGDPVHELFEWLPVANDDWYVAAV